MIELAILGLLKERPMHGYQVQRELSEQLGGLWRVSYGSLYPSLRRLEREGAITSQPGAAGRPPQDRLHDHRRGRAPVPASCSRSPRRRTRPRTHDSGFGSRSSSTCRPRRGSGCSSAGAARSQERLAEISSHLRASGTTDDYQRALLEHARAATQADIAWLTDLIHTERQKFEITAPEGGRRRASATLRRKERTG